MPGAGRSHPRRLRSRDSTVTGDRQVAPLSPERCIDSTTLLSLRSAHHTRNNSELSPAVRIDRTHGAVVSATAGIRADITELRASGSPNCEVLYETAPPLDRVVDAAQTHEYEKKRDESAKLHARTLLARATAEKARGVIGGPFCACVPYL